MSEQELLVGELFDNKYRIEALLGHGGMGSVYRALHVGTKRTVAVKVIRPQYANNDEFIERFRREAEAAGRLRHPNVVDVTDFGFAQIGSGLVAYLVMEYLDGCSLGEVLAEEESLTAEWVVDILEQVCSALDAAHQLGIIHRDLKPENIWLEPNRRGGYTVKVLDFGLVKLGALTEPASRIAGTGSDPWHRAAAEAKPVPPFGQMPSTVETAGELPTLGSEIAASRSAGGADLSAGLAEYETSMDPAPEGSGAGSGASGDSSRSSELTRLGSVMGTPLFMSPEQCRGEALDARTDIYSLGVMAYRMLASKTPFTGDTRELLRLHTSVPAPVLKAKRGRLPRGMVRVIMSALEKDPALRPQSVAGFGSALRASIEGTGTLLRKAVSLYAERFPTFLKMSLVSYAPLVALVLSFLFADRWADWASASKLTSMMIGLALTVLLVGTNLLCYAIVSALTVPGVVQLTVAPLRPLRVRTLFERLRHRWRTFAAASAAVFVTSIVGTVLGVVPGFAAAVAFALYAPVAVMEEHGVFGTLKRAWDLVRRSLGTVIVITAIEFALPVLVWIVSADTSFKFRLDEHFNPKELSFHFSYSGTSALFQLLNIGVTPLTAIMTALLYLKTRRAGGESLRDAIGRFDALEMPRSRWESKMRNRTNSGSTSV